MEFTHWTLEYLDGLDIERLFPLYFEYVHSKTGERSSGPRRKMVYADQAAWLQ